MSATTTDLGSQGVDDFPPPLGVDTAVVERLYLKRELRVVETEPDVDDALADQRQQIEVGWHAVHTLESAGS